jgi:hypothetical protein
MMQLLSRSGRLRARARLNGKHRAEGPAVTTEVTWPGVGKHCGCQNCAVGQPEKHVELVAA